MFKERVCGEIGVFLSIEFEFNFGLQYQLRLASDIFKKKFH